MTKKEIMNRLDAMHTNYDKKVKKAELEQLLQTAEAEQTETAEAEQTETAENALVDTLADELNTDLESMLRDSHHDVISAHGGFAIKKNRRRACEVSKNKRTQLYKVAFHKSTFEKSRIFLNDYTCIEQKLNYIVRDLQCDEAYRLIEILVNNK